MLIKEDLVTLFRKHKTDREIYHDLMQYHVREILLVTTLYDAFILEEEDKLTEKIFGEYYNLNLSTAPRITHATFTPEVIELLKVRHFDIIILTMRIDEMTPFELAEKMKQLKPDIPVFLLLYDNSDLELLKDKRDKLDLFEKVFVWNRDSKIFIAIIKYIEDKLNAFNDTKIGHVRIILLVENSIRYYSRYLPILFTEIIKQTQRLITEDNLDEMKKILRMRARPKVLMAVNYEEALAIYEKYKDYLLCVISDVKFPKENKIDEQAGIKLIQHIKKEIDDIPFLLQSSDDENEKIAREMKAGFINKNSNTLSHDLTEFVLKNLGFGDFIFRDKNGKVITRASSLSEFKNKLKDVPSLSLLYHGEKNHFSAWLMARGEIQFAELLEPIKVSDFTDAEALRKYLIQIATKVEDENRRGRVADFDEIDGRKDVQIVRLSNGSFGGKGRGIVFVNTLLENSSQFSELGNVSVKIPRTAIIGTEEYDEFLDSNQLREYIYSASDYISLKYKFLSCNLSSKLTRKLEVYLKSISTPIAVRSSGLFEDSISESFSGIYQTFLLPNNHTSFDVRFKQLTDSIKLVYASVFSKEARSYFEAINYKIEEEKMGIVIQEMVGSKQGDWFYPHFSGVAQSYNYYPIEKMKPSDGITVAGVGLGKYVIDGEQAYRFCPKFPKRELTPPELTVKNTQSFFYAVDLRAEVKDLSKGEDITLVKLDIAEAEKDGVLEQIASVWDNHDKRIKESLATEGPRIINFSGILKYNYFPLAKTLEVILEMLQTSISGPVEIEFAVDMNEEKNEVPVFYILQIKPLIRDTNYFNLNVDEIKKKELLLYTPRGMGNGKIEDICDVIYVDPDKFDKSKTTEMTYELEKLNDILKSENKKYILIGPGRWGTRDKWLGIPVVWTQISNAKIIVETDLKDFVVDASLGSHFFHNITSMNIGYFTVHNRADEHMLDWEWLQRQKCYSKTDYFVHIRFNKPLRVMMDGRKSISLIYKV